MKSIPTRLPSPAVVVACTALVVSMGGAGYAATALPKNSVGTAQLKKASVNGDKVKAASPRTPTGSTASTRPSSCAWPTACPATWA